ncbi:hypothetical protein ACIBH1_02115 [Nonomuraea sp. NPDC050663]
MIAPAGVGAEIVREAEGWDPDNDDTNFNALPALDVDNYTKS